MPSIISGYEYDIFISYRQNDNRSGWVTEFVQHLNEELAATIKEPVSVYFDANPHDGLLETHNVDKSLERKLKCLIFIPILSQTYCDTKSFAWLNEFCAFNLTAQDDPFGMEILLPNGNVASRILPIKIHEIDFDDRQTIEKEIGSTLRSIDFIFKSVGVNRQLHAHEEHPHDNQNKTYYRDQINKVALAVKDLIRGMQKPGLKNADPRPDEVPQSWFLKKNILRLAIAFIAVAAGYLTYTRVAGSKTNKEVDKSIAVLAFTDLSPGKDQEWFSDGLSDEILNRLTQLKQLRVTARTSSFYFKGKNIPVPEMATKLGVAHLVEGSVQRVGNRIKITAQLIKGENGFHLWSRSYDRPAEDLLQVEAEIAESIASSLFSELSDDLREKLASRKTSSNEAYDFYRKGNYFHDRFRSSLTDDDFKKAENNFLQALKVDPKFADAMGELANLYDTYGLFHKTAWQKRDSLLRVGYKLDPESVSILCTSSFRFGKEYPNPDSAFYYLKKAYKLSPQDFRVNYSLVLSYFSIGLLDEAEILAEKAIHQDPLSPTHYNILADIYLDEGKIESAFQTALKAMELQNKSDAIPNALFNYYILKRDVPKIKEVIDRLKGSATSSNNLEWLELMIRGEKEAALKATKSNSLKFMIRYFTHSTPTELMEGFDETVKRIGLSATELELNPFYESIRAMPEFQKILKERKIIEENFRRQFGKLD